MNDHIYTYICLKTMIYITWFDLDLKYLFYPIYTQNIVVVAAGICNLRISWCT